VPQTVQEEFVVYAIMETGGKQYKVSVGQTLDVELLHKPAGEQVEFDQVLMVVDGDQISVGTPVVEGAKITATVTDEIKGDKIRIFRYTGKRYRRRLGHRQHYTRLHIDGIVS
jgi:large subunit ribosomal protein L21